MSAKDPCAGTEIWHSAGKTVVKVGFCDEPFGGLAEGFARSLGLRCDLIDEAGCGLATVFRLSFSAPPDPWLGCR